MRPYREGGCVIETCCFCYERIQGPSHHTPLPLYTSCNSKLLKRRNAKVFKRRLKYKRGLVISYLIWLYTQWAYINFFKSKYTSLLFQ